MELFVQLLLALVATPVLLYLLKWSYRVSIFIGNQLTETLNRSIVSTDRGIRIPINTSDRSQNIAYAKGEVKFSLIVPPFTSGTFWDVIPEISLHRVERLRIPQKLFPLWKILHPVLYPNKY